MNEKTINSGERTNKTTRPYKEFAVSVFIVLFSTLFALGAGEVFLRLKNSNMKNYNIEMWRYAKTLKRQSPNPILGHEHIPSSQAKLQSIDIRINKDGLRGGEIPPLGDSEKRVLFLGSSITFGWGVPEPKTLTEVLNAKFEADGKSVSVLNGGIGNYNTVRYVERFMTKLAPLKPDVIVVQYFINDAEVLETGGGNWFLRNSQMAVTLWIAANRLFKPTGASSLVDHYKKIYDPQAKGYQAMSRSLQRLSDYGKAKNIPVVLAMTPDVNILENYPFKFIHQNLKKLSEKFGFIYVDLFPSLAEVKSENIWAMGGDPHPNALGHRLMAEALYPVLKSLVSTSGSAPAKSPTTN